MKWTTKRLPERLCDHLGMPDYMKMIYQHNGRNGYVYHLHRISDELVNDEPEWLYVWNSDGWDITGWGSKRFIIYINNTLRCGEYDDHMDCDDRMMGRSIFMFEDGRDRSFENHEGAQFLLRYGTLYDRDGEVIEPPDPVDDLEWTKEYIYNVFFDSSDPSVRVDFRDGKLTFENRDTKFKYEIVLKPMENENG